MSYQNNDIDLSIIIPAYNAEPTIETVVKNISKVIEDANISYEIISVNDGSIDETLVILQKLEGKFNLSYVSYSASRECTITGKSNSIEASICSLKLSTCLFLLL